MRRVVAAFLFAFCCCSLVSAEAPKSLIRIDGLSLKEVREMGVSGFDVAKAGKTFVEIVVSETEKTKIKKSGKKVQVIIPDLDAYVTAKVGAQRNGVQYYTFDTMTAKMQEWAKQYEKIARLSSIGKSCEGRDIWAMKVSDNPELDEKEPAALIMGGTHAREWIAVEVPMDAMQKYLEGYGKDEKITQLVNEREVWFVPMVNPDGIQYSQTKSRYWRKNRRNNDGRNFGVDLNRNYGYQWGMTGASNSPSADTYHGAKAFSEPETTAIKELAEKEHFQGSISFHSYSELVLYPFGYAYDIPNPDDATFKKLAGEMAKFNKYTPQNSADLYPAMGDSDDWLCGAQKTLAFTFELATTFIPDPKEIAGINQLNTPAVLHLIDKCGTYGLSTPTGDKKLAASLDFSTACAALQDGEALLTDSAEEAKTKTADQLVVIQNRVAELVAADLIQGKTDSWQAIKALPKSQEVEKLIKNRITFASAHENLVSPEILLEIQKLR